MAELLGEVLPEGASERDVQELHPATDREHGHVALQRSVEERELGTIALLVDAERLAVCLLVVEIGIEIGTAREQQSVQRLQRLLHSVFARRHEQGAPARTLDALDRFLIAHRGGTKFEYAASDPSRAGGLIVRDDSVVAKWLR